MWIKRGNGNLGARPWLTSNGLHFNCARCKFRSFHFKQLHDKAWIATRKSEVDTTESFVYCTKVRTNALSWTETLSGNLFLVGNNTRGATKVDVEGTTLNALDESRDDFSALTTELFHDRELLGFANLLNNYLLSCLCRDATEVILWLKREDNFFTKYGVALDTLSVLKKHVLLSVIARELTFRSFLLTMWMEVCFFLHFSFLSKTHHRIVDDGLYLLKENGASSHVEFSAHYLTTLSVFLLIRSSHRALDSVDHGLFGNTALFELSEH